jgi:hypothetical protein
MDSAGMAPLSLVHIKERLHLILYYISSTIRGYISN